MTFPKARLAVSIFLLVGWLGFLLYLVIDARTVILSKPQFMTAEICVVLEIRDDGGKPAPQVTVDEVLWSRIPIDGQLASKALQLPDLSVCTKAHGYHGAGKYVVPLKILPKGNFQVAPIPRVFGHRQEEIRIYQATPDVRRQVEKLAPAK